MKPPRGLTAEERAVWARLARTVTPLDPSRLKEIAPPPALAPALAAPRAAVAKAPAKAPPKAAAAPRIAAPPPPPKPQVRSGLDSHWDRRLKAGSQEPDFSLDLHGLTLDQAHTRLEMGLAQARALGARLVLVVTGKPRPVHAADRGERRGAIRAKILDWLAVGRHGDAIAAIRKAHRRHGGEGALYLVLRRER